MAVILVELRLLKGGWVAQDRAPDVFGSDGRPSAGWFA
jgi:hypothetical protein